MPIELVDVGSNSAKFTFPDFSGSLEKRSSIDAFRIDNERANRNTPVLEPLLGMKDSEGKPISTGQLKPLFTYLSRTRQLEVDTAKTAYLQKIADKMTKNTDIQSRVAVMQKGKVEQAFATTDGTIFLSQNLINSLDSVDEIAAVIAHEVGHLLNHTAEKKNETWNTLGVSWVHELASDTQAPSLLEKAGFNSLAFASAIEKLAGFKRGIEHQGGVARASESIGTHFGIDRKTSAQAFLAKPDLLLGEVKSSNLELFTHAHEAQDRKKAAEILELLHPQDLISAYKELSELQKQELIKVKINWEHAEIIKEDEKEIALQKKAATEIRKILAENGATEDEQTVALMCASSNNNSGESRRFSEINDPDKIRDLACLISKYEERKKLSELCEKAAFPNKVTKNAFLSVLGHDLFIPSNTPKARGIPVNEESLLDTLTALSDPADFEDYYRRYTLNLCNSRVILAYIDRYHVKPQVLENAEKAKLSPSEIKKIQVFLEKVRERKLLNNEGVERLERDMGIAAKFLDHAGRFYSLDYYAEISKELADVLLEDTFFKEEEIEPFFRDLQKDNVDSARSKLGSFFIRIEDAFHRMKYLEKRMPENEKLRIAQKIMDGIRINGQLNADHGFLRYGISVAAAIFRYDTDQFYTLMDKVASSGEIRGLSSELAFFCLKPIFEKNYSSSSMNMLVTNFDRFSKIPLVQLALEYSLFKSEPIESLGQLAAAAINVARRDTTKKYPMGVAKSFFEDSLEGLILGQGYRKKLLELTRGDIPNSDLSALHMCLKLTYPDGPEKTHFLRAISKKILISPDLPFVDKLSYLEQNIDELVPEGLSLLAEQIQSLYDYEAFRIAMQKHLNEYLSGKAITLDVAALDFVSSYFAKGFEKLFDLCRANPESQAKASTDFAKHWIAGVISGSQRDIAFDFKMDRFLLREKEKQRFRTASEIIDALHGLTGFERFAIAHKALTERDGAFSSAENRQKLSRQIIDALQTENPFIRRILTSACQKGDAKFLTFPASRMLGPLLFRSLDKTKISIEEVSELYISSKRDRRIKDLPPGNSLLKTLSSGRREISAFGSNYRKYPDTPFFRLSQESDQQFQLLTSRLHEMLDEPKQNEELNGASEINPSLEAIVKGVEGSGALGVRSLQLAVQIYGFSEPVRRRLSESFDQNPGLNKLLFWENLHKLSEEYPKTREFVQRLRLKGYLGGGSLYTTFEAVVSEDDKEKRVALKMLNPNSEAFLKESHSLAENVLEDVRKQREMRRLADMGLVLTDLAHQWCLKDINDQTFAEDDDEFRTTVEKFNARGEGAKYTIPERVFNTYNLKAENLALGRTVNKVLNDEQVPNETKQSLVKKMVEFFAFQLKSPKVQKDGETYTLVHSDPHIGNYIVNLENENTSIAVIDRHMYLKLADQDVFVLEHFIGGDDLKFLSTLTERVLDVNKVSNRVERLVTTARVKSSLMRNYFSQKTKGKVDKFSLLRTALSEFQKRGLDVPLNLRLMIRNIQAFKNLAGKYGLDFGEIYRDFNTANTSDK